MVKNILIVGGTSGLGLSLASLLLTDDGDVCVTGRTDPIRDSIRFYALDIDTDTLAINLDTLLSSLPKIDLLIYAAGFYEEARIAESSDTFIMKMERVGLLAPMLLVAKLMRKQGSLSEFVAVTSTSQWTPRELEPSYSAVKAGLGMFANSLSLDPAIGKVLVIGVAGMATPFWKDSSRDVSTMLHPDWVAAQIVSQLVDGYDYKLVKILRNPARVEIVETR